MLFHRGHDTIKRIIPVYSAGLPSPEGQTCAGALPIAKGGEPLMQQTKCLQAKMFGGLQIQVGDRYLVEKGGRVNKPIELLVYLLLNRGT